jgi:hypothetical protein
MKRFSLFAVVAAAAVAVTSAFAGGVRTESGPSKLACGCVNCACPNCDGQSCSCDVCACGVCVCAK